MGRSRPLARRREHLIELGLELKGLEKMEGNLTQTSGTLPYAFEFAPFRFDRTRIFGALLVG